MSHDRGQAATEYMLLSVMWVGVLFVPWFGGTSIFLAFVQLFDIYLNSFHAVLSLPVP
jgi:hypothetical protein